MVPGGTHVSGGVTFGPLKGVYWTIEGKNLLGEALYDARQVPLPGRAIYTTLTWRPTRIRQELSGDPS
jgi:hypothetical protein